MGGRHVLDHRAPLGFGVLEDQVGLVPPDHWQVGGYNRNLQSVNLVKLVGLCGGRTGHTGQLPVHSEVVLQGNSCVGDALPLDFQPLFGFHRLVQTIGPTTPELEAPGEFVNDDHFPVPYYIVFVPVLLHLGVQRIFNVMHQVKVVGVVQVVNLGRALHLPDSLLAQGDGLGALVNGIVLVRVKAGRQLGKGVVMLHRFFRRAADDQGSARLINQDVVHFVNDGVVALPLYPLDRLDRHIVPQIIKTEFVIGAIQHVGLVGLLAGDLAQGFHPIGGHGNLRVVPEGAIVLEAADTQPQAVVDGAHPYRVAAGQVVVNRYHVDAPTGQGIQVHRQGSDQGFALAGFHFGNLASVQHHAPDQLYVVMPLSQMAARRLADYGKGFGQQVVRGFALGQSLPELIGFVPQFVVGQAQQVSLQSVDNRHQVALDFINRLFAGIADELTEQGNHIQTPPQIDTPRSWRSVVIVKIKPALQVLWFHYSFIALQPTWHFDIVPEWSESCTWDKARRRPVVRRWPALLGEIRFA